MDDWPGLLWDELGYRRAQGSFSDKGKFIVGKLEDHDAAKLKDVFGRPVPGRGARPDGHHPVVILRFMGADAEEIRDVQTRMGRAWR